MPVSSVTGGDTDHYTNEDVVRQEVNKRRDRKELGGSQAGGKQKKGQKMTRWLPGRR